MWVSERGVQLFPEISIVDVCICGNVNMCVSICMYTCSILYVCGVCCVCVCVYDSFPGL